MAAIPRDAGLPRIEPGAAPAVYQNLKVSPDTFGAESARQMAAAAQAFGQGAMRLSEAGFDLQRDYTRTAADSGVNAFTNEQRVILRGTPGVSVPGPDGQSMSDSGFLGLKGADAMSAQEATQKAIDDALNRIEGGLKEPGAKEIFRRRAMVLRQNAFDDIARHTQEQSTVWATTVNQTTEQSALTSIANNANDPARVAQAETDLVAARLKMLQIKGLAGDPEIVRQTAEQGRRDALAVRADAIGATDPARALELVERNETLLGPQYPKLYGHFRTRADQQIGETVGMAAAAGAGLQAPLPPPGAPSPQADAVMDAIIQQESGGNPNAPTSVDGAIGPGQIMPATFARYARPGEQIDNRADNLAVSRRIIDDLSAKFGGDPERIAVGYFSGEGNVAPPGSPTPWINDFEDGNGKRVSAYVEDIAGRLGGVVSETPAQRLAQSKSEAYRTILDNPDLSPAARTKAFETINRVYQARDAERIDQERSQRMAEQARTRASEETESKIIENLTSVNPTVTAAAIGASDVLKPDAKLRMLAFADRVNKPEPLARESHDTLLNVMDRMSRPEGDPLRIYSADQITDAFNEGKMTRADYSFAMKQFTNARSADGQILEKQKAEFFKGVGPLIDESNPLLGKVDPSGREQMYRFQWYVAEEVERYRKAGKNPWDLFNPSKPDYLGRPEALAPFQKTLQQSIRDVSDKLRPVAPTGAPVEQPVAAPQAAPAAPAIPPRPEHIPADARYSPSQGAWWWQEGGEWKTAR